MTGTLPPQELEARYVAACKSFWKLRILFEECETRIAELERERDKLREDYRASLEHAGRLAEDREEALARERRLREALRECIPYVRNAMGPSESPWRIETAEGVLGRVEAALADGEDT